MRRILAAPLLILAMPPAQAGALRPGAAPETGAIDPRYHWFGPLIEVARRVFGPMVAIGPNGAAAGPGNPADRVEAITRRSSA